MKRRLTVILPVRNGAATIERAVKSAVEAGADYVYAFNDNSVDTTFHILDKLTWEYPNFFMFSFGGESRNGVNFARNYLIEQVEEGLILPLDADDELMPDVADLIKAQWQPNTWLYGDYIEVDNGQANRIHGAPAGTLGRKNPTGITFAFHKTDWEKCGGYDPDFAYIEDYAFQCALTHCGVQPSYVQSVFYKRHLHPEGNPRTAKAQAYWDFYHRMAREKYPSAFK